MLAKCANVACNVEFRELSKGRLFLLPPPNFSCEHFKLTNYCYWLCPGCDSTHTITRSGTDVLVGERGWALCISAPLPQITGKGLGSSLCGGTRSHRAVAVELRGLTRLIAMAFQAGGAEES